MVERMKDGPTPANSDDAVSAARTARPLLDLDRAELAPDTLGSGCSICLTVPKTYLSPGQSRESSQSESLSHERDSPSAGNVCSGLQVGQSPVHRVDLLLVGLPTRLYLAEMGETLCVWLKHRYKIAPRVLVGVIAS